MKLNLGCGHHRKPGWRNVDRYPACGPDELVDLERFPWPWPDGAAHEVLFNHSLEHMGQSADVFIGIMRELWRVCAPGALVQINVPDPRHDNFLGDPTHVRPVTLGVLSLFSQRLNQKWIAESASNTPLGLIHGIDFEVETHERFFAEPWATMRAQGRIAEDEIEAAVLRFNNVIVSHAFLLVAVK
jgi:hypothetical protein